MKLKRYLNTTHLHVVGVSCGHDVQTTLSPGRPDKEDKKLMSAVRDQCIELKSQPLQQKWEEYSCVTWFMDIGFSDLWLLLISQQLSLGTRSSYPPPCERMGSKILNIHQTLYLWEDGVWAWDWLTLHFLNSVSISSSPTSPSILPFLIYCLTRLDWKKPNIPVSSVN